MSLPTIQSQNCPDCKKHMHECDNSCGTYYCPVCKEDWNMPIKGILVKGHAPNCGDSSDE